MATRRKPARRRAATKRKTKSKSKGFPFWVTGFVLLALIVGGGYWAYLNLDDLRLFANRSLERESVEGLLIAAGQDLTSQRQISEKDENGVERWKIELSSKKKKEAILKGLRRMVENNQGSWSPEEISRKGELITLVDVNLEDGTLLRLILVSSESRTSRPKKQRQSTPVASRPPPKKTPERPKPVPEPVVETVRKHVPHKDGQPTIAIILDDVGQDDVDKLAPVLDLKYPITFAVIPFLPYSKTNAEYLHRNRYEVMLHMPMEPDNYPKNNPGEGAIFTHFTEDEIRHALTNAIRDVPFITGANNHMGSKVTSSRALMAPVLDELKKRNLYYVDSRTNSKTIAHKLALEMGLDTARRDVFLDAEVSYDFVVKQLAQTCKVADKTGSAIAIGHPHASTLKALADELPKLNAQGYRFVFASAVIESRSGQL